jgi:hypothetical protein
MFAMDLSAVPSDIAKLLEEATHGMSWATDYFETTADLASYKLVIETSLPSQGYTTIKKSPPGPPFEVHVSCGRTALNGPHRDRPRISATQRFQERRRQREMARESRNNDSESRESPANDSSLGNDGNQE